MRFCETLKSTKKDAFEWIVFNETCLDCSPKGYFDMIEHAHFYRGPKAKKKEPLITNIFTRPSDSKGTGVFGIGQDLPDIDLFHKE